VIKHKHFGFYHAAVNVTNITLDFSLWVWYITDITPMEKMMNQYIVVPQGNTFSRRWAILDTHTGFIVEGGFSSRHAAQDYIAKEYTT
jgi:uncharacterized protein YbdZ (MbtH family)